MEPLERIANSLERIEVLLRPIASAAVFDIELRRIVVKEMYDKDWEVAVRHEPDSKEGRELRTRMSLKYDNIFMAAGSAIMPDVLAALVGEDEK